MQPPAEDGPEEIWPACSWYLKAYAIISQQSSLAREVGKRCALALVQQFGRDSLAVIRLMNIVCTLILEDDNLAGLCAVRAPNKSFFAALH